MLKNPRGYKAEFHDLVEEGRWGSPVSEVEITRPVNNQDGWELLPKEIFEDTKLKNLQN